MPEWIHDREQRAGRLQLGDGLTIAEVGRIREYLLQGFTETEQLVVDLAAVAAIDLAGLQLLCSAHRYAALHGKALMVTGENQRVRALVRQAGLVRVMPCNTAREVPCLWAGMA